ncbi:hypothetical protein FRC12_020333, partial [Ceratobasidium sp. 428]
MFSIFGQPGCRERSSMGLTWPRSHAPHVSILMRPRICRGSPHRPSASTVAGKVERGHPPPTRHCPLSAQLLLALAVATTAPPP